jgi:hypothetical protein
MRLVRHLRRLLGDLFSFAREERIWWIVPIVLAVLVIALIVGVSQVMAPYIYTLF